ncbi:hypothetical protein [Micromonospora echinaurantiaca]|uniref:hypothetical protein n=1 Tax=Micromonospora echinaurantiaca TaxID=47857 RepID=UPI003F4D9D09
MTRRSSAPANAGEAWTLVRKWSAGPEPETKNPAGPYSARPIASRHRVDICSAQLSACVTARPYADPDPPHPRRRLPPASSTVIL